MKKDNLYLHWALMQDLIGDASTWPHKICRLFWSMKPNHWERVQMAAFVFLNGLDPKLFMEWWQIRNRLTAQMKCHWDYLFRALDDNRPIPGP